MREDAEAESEWLARKIAKLRIFRDDNDRMNRSVVDVGGSALVGSQFTLAAETKGIARGSQPPLRLRTVNACTITSRLSLRN